VEVIVMTTTTRTGLDVLEASLSRAEATAAAARPARDGALPIFDAMAHVAQGIEYSLTGYPERKSRLFTATIGRIALGRFLSRGAMKHDRSAPIPGASTPTGGPNEVERLRAAVAAFRAHGGELAPHFAFGAMPKDDYARIHAMHLDDHLAAFDER
jgi:hypothetical protein